MPGQMKDKKHLLLSDQTLNAWEMICKSIPECIQFLLREGTKYVMARVFCQDMLEQHFSKQRAALGGNRNPHPDQFLRTGNLLHLQEGLSLKRRGANTESLEAFLDETPLPKRKKPVRRSLNLMAPNLQRHENGHIDIHMDIKLCIYEIIDQYF